MTHPRVVHKARFKQALAERVDSCQADSDCACYPGGTEASGCGGVTSKNTAAVLTPVAEGFRKDAAGRASSAPPGPADGSA